MSAFSSVIWLADVDIESGKTGNYTKQLAKLELAEFPLLPAFVITADAYFTFLRENKLDHKIHQLLSTVSFELPDSLMQVEHHIKQLFAQAEVPEELVDELSNFCLQLDTDEVTLSLFETGPHEKKHATKHARSLEELIETVIAMWSEMFTGKALWHRHQHHHNHVQAGAEILVQKKMAADKSGRVISIEPLTHAKDKIVIISDHPHTGDTYVLSKKNLTIIDRAIKHTTNLHKLTHEEIITLGQIAKEVEAHFYFPHEITWGITGDEGYIVEIKPVSSLPVHLPEKKKKLPIARGKGETARIGTGVATILHSPTNITPLTSHSILIISEITPHLAKKLKKLQGIITESHPDTETIILLKQHGIPAIYGVKDATKQFRNGRLITVNGATGEIYQGGFL